MFNIFSSFTQYVGLFVIAGFFENLLRIELHFVSVQGAVNITDKILDERESQNRLATTEESNWNQVQLPQK